MTKHDFHTSIRRCSKFIHLKKMFTKMHIQNNNDDKKPLALGISSDIITTQIY